MKQLTYLFLAITLMTFSFSACKNKQKNNTATVETTEEASIPDSTVYGVCGDNTAMHTLELITDAGDTLHYIIGEDEDGNQHVVGGLMAGDRLAVVEGPEIDGEKSVNKIINLTTLIGKWTSLDKNFEIEEGGIVKSNVEAEKNPWTSWKILNGHLLLNRDTFDIDELGSDSLYLENKEGIFVYKRGK